MNQTEQLKRAGHLLVRPKKKGGKKRKWIPRVSTRRVGQKAMYARILPAWIAEHPRCEIGPIIKKNGFAVRCLGRTTSVHHQRGRRGEFLCDSRYFIASCSGECHPQWIHQTNKADAIRLGLIVQ